MSSVTRKIINRDSNKQTYRTDDSYEEQMRRPTERDAAILDKFRKESEFVKPYASDSYEEMEYGFIPPWDFGQWNDLSFPDVKWATPILEPWKLPPSDIGDDPKEKCHVILKCLPEICYCPGQEKCHDLYCSYRLISVRLTDFAGHSIPKGFSIYNQHMRVCITAPDDTDQTLSVYYLLEYQCDGKKYRTEIQGQAWVDACNESECCDDTTMSWNDPGSADTVARNANCTVAILDTLGKGGPYSWAVSGTGFTLTDATTIGLSNTLNADATACGTATVTVTGCGGTAVTGYVRCTTGNWVRIYTCGTCANFYTGCRTDATVVGNLRSIENWCTLSVGNVCGVDGCASPPYATCTGILSVSQTVTACNPVICQRMSACIDEWRC